MEPKQGMRHLFLSLAAAVMIAFVATSGFVGYRLGRSATAGAGALVDTIVLSPDQSLAQGRAEITHFLSGRLLETGGDPCGAATVRLLESGKADETDERGKFFFSDVRTGANTLEVVDEQGNLLGKATLTLDFQAGATPAVEENKLILPRDVRMVEVTLTLDAVQQSVSLDKNASCAVTSDGTVVNFSGQALSLSAGSASVVPGGDVVTGEGYVLLPSKAVAITPWGGRQDLTPAGTQQTIGQPESSAVESEAPPESNAEEAPGTESSAAESTPESGFPEKPGSELPGAPESETATEDVIPEIPGVSMDEDGDMILDNGAQIAPDGTVTVPDEEPVGPSDDVVFIPPEGPAETLPELPEVYEPEATPDEAPAPETPPANDGLPETPAADAEEEPTPDEPTPEPEPTPAPEPFSVSWTQQSMVDLFKNRTSGQNLGTETVVNKTTGQEEEVAVIAPGSSGYYDFNLKNDADFNIRFTLSISELGVHLPILYSVRDLQTNYVYQGGSKVYENGSAISTDYITLPAHSECRYRLGWEWQYEDWLAPWYDNPIDTRAGSGEDRTYMISVDIHAQQLYSATSK